jgi:hypothetical protein
VWGCRIYVDRCFVTKQLEHIKLLTRNKSMGYEAVRRAPAAKNLRTWIYGVCLEAAGRSCEK